MARSVIEELRINDLGVIEAATVELGPGLTVVTGETGAGKTMVVTALGLLMGGRPDAAAVRAGAARAVVEGRFGVPPGSAAEQRADEAGAELDEGALLVARTVSREGRSRAHAGGRSVPAALLAELADDLVAVHGQSDQQRLLEPARQRAALDRFAGPAVLDVLASYRETWAELRRVEVELADVVEHGRERSEEAERLRFGLERVNEVAPQPGEDVALAAEADRLRHAEDLRVAAHTAHSLLVGEASNPDASDDVVTRVGLARRAVEPWQDHDPTLADLGQRLAEVSYLVADLASDLASYATSVESDPARLATVEDRRSALLGLTRVYGATVDEVLTWAANAGARLLSLDDDDARRSRLTDEIDDLRSRLNGLAGELTAARATAAGEFSAAVTAELTALAMPDATVSVALRARPELGAAGAEDVEIELAPHVGAPSRPIARGASGGELSRVMLAVEVVFAGADPVPTLVFDEVDAGIGGRAAVEVGARLARLAQTAQVLVVTHLPQVAAYADHHLLVEKASTGAVTASGVRSLDDEERVRELTRMLAGLEESESGAAHARELLAAAAAAKGSSE